MKPSKPPAGGFRWRLRAVVDDVTGIVVMAVILALVAATFSFLLTMLLR